MLSKFLLLIAAANLAAADTITLTSENAEMHTCMSLQLDTVACADVIDTLKQTLAETTCPGEYIQDHCTQMQIDAGTATLASVLLLCDSATGLMGCTEQTGNPQIDTTDGTEIACTAHSDCGNGEFCMENMCEECSECHVCADGIDATCGTCGEGFPTQGGECGDGADDTDCVDNESCLESCDGEPTTCDEFRALTGEGGCASTCCHEVVADHETALCGGPAVHCATDTTATKATCTADCGTVDAVVATAAANGGDACAMYNCMDGDGECEDSDNSSSGFSIAFGLLVSYLLL